MVRVAERKRSEEGQECLGQEDRVEEPSIEEIREVCRGYGRYRCARIDNGWNDDERVEGEMMWSSTIESVLWGL